MEYEKRERELRKEKEKQKKALEEKKKQDELRKQEESAQMDRLVRNMVIVLLNLNRKENLVQ